MSFLFPKQQQPQQPQMTAAPQAEAKAATPPIMGAPQGQPGGRKKGWGGGRTSPASFLGQETSPDSTNLSNKTLLGQ